MNNWYKKAAMGQPDLFDKETMQSTETQKYYGDLLEDFEETVKDWNDFLLLADHYKLQYEKIEFPKFEGINSAPPILLIEYKDRLYITEADLSDYSLTPALEWLNNISDDNLFLYVGEKDESKIFWDEVGRGSVVYHATDPENVPSIKQRGLLISNKTRGFTNRSTGNAIFASFNENAIESYGTAVITINVGLMKESNYMPKVSTEAPISDCQDRQSLAWKIGLRDYYCEPDSSDGLSEETVIFYDNIPPQFLSFNE